MEIDNLLPENRSADIDVADYILLCHDGDAKAAIEAMQEEIEHLQHQLRLPVGARTLYFRHGNADRPHMAAMLRMRYAENGPNHLL